MTSPFEPRTVASVHTIGCRLTPTHQEPVPEVEDEAADEEQVQAKVVSSPRRKSPRTTGDAETK